MPAEIEKLFIYNPSKNTTISHVFLSNPDENKIMFFGQLFGIIDFECDDKDIFPILQEMTTSIEEMYYNFSIVEKKTFILSEHFENALKIINTIILQILTKNHLDKKIDHLHILIGALKNNRLCLGNAGGNYAFLLYKSKTSSYKIADIIGNYKIKPEKTDMYKIFPHFIEGEFHFNDYLLFTSQSLLNHLTIDELKNIITHATLPASIDEIRNQLWKASINTSFALLLLWNKPHAHYTDGTKKSSDAPQKSINKLLRTASVTEKFLSISFFPNVAKQIRTLISFSSLFIAIVKKVGIRSLHMISSMLSSRINHFRKLTGFSGTEYPMRSKEKGVEISPHAFLLNCKRKLRTLFKKLIQICEQPRHIWMKGTLFQKLAFIGVLLLSTILWLSIHRETQKEQKTFSEKTFQSSIIEIDELLSKIDSALIYNDKKKASDSLKIAERVLNALPSDTKDHIVMKSNYAAQFEKVALSLRKVVPIRDVHRIVELPKDEISPRSRIIRYKDHILFIGKHILNITLLGDPLISTSSALLPSIPLVDVSSGSEKAGYIVMLFDDKTLMRYNIKQNLLTMQQVSWDSKEKDIIDIEMYQEKLYALVPHERQIFRHFPANIGYGAGMSWIKEQIETFIPNGGMFIDGYVYLISQDGKILRLLSGKQVSYKLSSIDPEWNHVDKILSDSTTKNIYIFETALNRIGVFSKEKGEFLYQYQGDENMKIIDFAPDEQRQTLYFITEYALYKTPLFTSFP